MATPSATSSAGAGFAAYRSRLADPLAAAGFDWNTIIQIIQQLLAGCGKPSVRRVRLASVFRGNVASAVYKAYPDISDDDAFKIAGIHRDAVKKATDDELQSFIDDSCS